MMMVWLIVLGGINVVLVVLLAVLLRRESQVERECHEASVQALASAVDHLVARNNLLLGELVRRQGRKRMRSDESSRSL
jgi:hypothetical protein